MEGGLGRRAQRLPPIASQRLLVVGRLLLHLGASYSVLVVVVVVVASWVSVLFLAEFGHEMRRS